MTALLHTAYKGNREASQLLIERGADVNSNLQSDGVSATAVVHSQSTVLELSCSKPYTNLISLPLAIISDRSPEIISFSFHVVHCTDVRHYSR